MELQLLRGDEVVYVRPVGTAPVYLGRAPSNDLVLVDRKISGRHAVVWRVGDELRVEDLGSRNGTHVNGARITAPTLLHAGDVLLDKGTGRSTGRPCCISSDASSSATGSARRPTAAG